MSSRLCCKKYEENQLSKESLSLFSLGCYSEQLGGKRQNSEEDLAWRSSVGYACRKQPTDEE